MNMNSVSLFHRVSDQKIEKQDLGLGISDLDDDAIKIYEDKEHYNGLIKSHNDTDIDKNSGKHDTTSDHKIN